MAPQTSNFHSEVKIFRFSTLPSMEDLNCVTSHDFHAHR